MPDHDAYVLHHVEGALHDLGEFGLVWFAILPPFAMQVDQNPLLGPVGEARIVGQPSTNIVLWKRVYSFEGGDIEHEGAPMTVWSFPSFPGVCVKPDDLFEGIKASVAALNDMAFAKQREHAKSTYSVYDVDAKTGQELDEFTGLFGISRAGNETDNALRLRFKSIAGEA